MHISDKCKLVDKNIKKFASGLNFVLIQQNHLPQLIGLTLEKWPGVKTMLKEIKGNEVLINIDMSICQTLTESFNTFPGRLDPRLPNVSSHLAAHKSSLILFVLFLFSFVFSLS